LHLRSFKSYLNHAVIGCTEWLNIWESTSAHEIFTNWRFHGQIKIAVYSHFLVATLSISHEFFQNPCQSFHEFVYSIRLIKQLPS
jgi:hypothetical protein